MARKRRAEDSAEPSLIAKSPKKRRTSDAEPVKASNHAAASVPSTSKSADKPAKKDKKSKKNKSGAKDSAPLEDDEAVQNFGQAPVQNPTSDTTQSKRKGNEPTDGNTGGDVSTDIIATTASSHGSEKERKRMKKESKRKAKAQKLATELSEAQKDEEKHGRSDASRARVKKLQSKLEKARLSIRQAENQSTVAPSSVDIDALRRQIRNEVLAELKEQDVKRKKNRRPEGKRKKAAKLRAQGEQMDVDGGDQAGDREEVNDSSNEATSSAARSSGLQMAQLDHAMASIDPSRFSTALQSRLHKLQALEWKLSASVGGRMSNIDPVFSHDEQSLLVAYPLAVKVYSTKTSLLIRTIPISKGFVTGIALSSDGSVLSIASDTGRLEQWNWSAGERVRSFELKSAIHSVSVPSAPSSNRKALICTVTNTSITANPWSIRLHDTESQIGDVDNKSILQVSTKPRRPILLDGGKIIVSATASKILVGVRQSADDANLSDIEYVWHELECPERISCITAYFAPGDRPDAHVAIGTSGPIILYRNLVSHLQVVSRKKSSTRPTVEKLHWHRYPVGDVRFSKDGQYLISGGFETVLCKWQLDTGKREDLPHMTAPIQRLVVSPNGASYAVMLANNSLTVLSILTYEPSFSTAELALPALIGSSEEEKQPLKSYPAALLSSSGLLQLLCATPSASGPGSSSSAVYLQSLDAKRGAQLEKQALTRTNVTDRVSDPEGRVLGEPDITHLVPSVDGKWLATSESWQPPARDLEYTTDKNEFHSVVEPRRETYLKFWSRDEKKNTWQLSSRIDNPHGDGPFQGGKILDLAVDGRGYVTVGGDGQIKVWRRHTRERNGLEIKDKTGTSLTSWHCLRTVAPPSPPVVDDATDVLVAAKLALSADDTLLVAVFKYKLSTVVRLIKTSDGSIILSRSDLLVDVLIGVAIVDQYLVILSDSVTVWDIVRDRLQFSYHLKASHRSLEASLCFSHLAAHSSRSFAIAVPTAAGDSSEVIVFDPASSEPIVAKKVPTLIRSLLAVPGSRDFFVVDALAQIQRVHAPHASIESLVALAAAEPESIEDEPAAPEPSTQLFNLPLRSAGTMDEDETFVADGERNAHSQAQHEALNIQESLFEMDDSASAPASGMGIFEKLVGFAFGKRAGRTAV